MGAIYNFSTNQITCAPSRFYHTADVFVHCMSGYELQDLKHTCLGRRYRGPSEALR